MVRRLLPWLACIAFATGGCSLLAPSDQELMGGNPADAGRSADGGDGGSRDSAPESEAGSACVAVNGSCTSLPCCSGGTCASGVCVACGASGAACGATACCSGRCNTKSNKCQ